MPGARLACVNVMPTSLIGIDDNVDAAGDNVHVRRLVEFGNWARPLQLPKGKVTYHLLESRNVAGAILDFARSNNVDHLMIGAPTRGGSFAQGSARRSPPRRPANGPGGQSNPFALGARPVRRTPWCGRWWVLSEDDAAAAHSTWSPPKGGHRFSRRPPWQGQSSATISADTDDIIATTDPPLANCSIYFLRRLQAQRRPPTPNGRLQAGARPAPPASRRCILAPPPGVIAHHCSADQAAILGTDADIESERGVFAEENGTDQGK